MDNKNRKSWDSQIWSVSGLNYFPWYSFLFPLFYVLHGYQHYHGVVSVGTTIQIAGEYLLGTILLLALAMLFFKSFRKSALFAFLVNFANFYLGVVQDQMILQEVLIPIAKISILVFLFFLLVAFLFYKFGAHINSSRNYIKFLNLLVLVFIFIDIYSLMTAPSVTSIARSENLPVVNISADSSGKDASPDIYFILLDEYAGTNSLEKGMGFSNDDFLNFLRDRGFFVADSSRSNYNSTLYSVASMLNLTYLPVREAKGENRSDVKLAYASIANNYLSELLQKRGYEFYNNSWFSMRNVKQLPNSSLKRAERDFIVAQTVLNRFRRNGLLRASRLLGWRQMESRIKEESKVYNAELEENLLLSLNRQGGYAPRFLYTHFSMPHYPFYFDRNGYAYPLDSLARISDTDSSYYLEYLLYCNSRLQIMVEQIMSKAVKPFVIFVVSDHGYRKMPGLDWDSRAYSSFVAVFDSRGGKFGMSNTVTNVNILRSWLKSEFEYKLEPLPDSFFMVRFQE